MTELQHFQPVMALDQMLGEIAAMHQKQAALNRQQLEALRAQTEVQTWLLQSLLAPLGARSPSPPLDDPKNFSDRFKSTAVACGWPASAGSARLWRSAR